jgi:hypothetical protein
MTVNTHHITLVASITILIFSLLIIFQPQSSSADVSNVIVNPTLGQSPLLVSLSITDPSTIEKVAWSFGDGTPVVTNGTSVTHTYQKPGNYSGLVVIVTTNGQVQRQAFTISVLGTGTNMVENQTGSHTNAFSYLQQQNNNEHLGVTIELDQKVYAWNDVVYITVVAPSCNTSPNEIDVIGDGTCGIISIQTSKDNLNSYKLIETNSNTGIFTGKITLDGTGYVSGITKGTGPNDGLIDASANDEIRVTFTRDSSSVTGSALISSSTSMSTTSTNTDQPSQCTTAYCYLQQEQSNISPTSQVTITTDKTSYKYGDLMTISGHVSAVMTGIPLIVILEGQNSEIHLGQVNLNPDGSFSDQVYASGPMWTKVYSNNYVVTARYDSHTFTGSSIYFSNSDNYTASAPNTSPVLSEPPKIPKWVKNIFSLYGQGQISDDELIQGIQFLVNSGIIHLK